MGTLLLGLLSGTLVGFVLALIGGGGSILAVPLLVQLVGVPSPHVALGTSAVAVAVSALSNLAFHARAGTVKWRCGALFAGSGVLGASLGAALGKAVDGDELLAVFGALMVLVGASMLRPRRSEGVPEVRLTRASARRLVPRLVGLGLLTGTASGFFGIGGGFLIVPALLLATDMPLPMAVGSSLVAVAAFGLTTALSYASSGLVDWPLSLIFIAGGVAGGLLGTLGAKRLGQHKRALSLTFACIVIAVGGYIILKGMMTFA